MSKMSKLWYEARDAIDNEKYLTASNRTLRKHIAELSIVQPWESEQVAWQAVDKKHGMINKLKKEIENRNQKFWGNVRIGLWTLLAGIIVGVVVVIFEHVFFPDKNQPNKETMRTSEPQQKESTAHSIPQNNQAIPKETPKTK